MKVIPWDGETITKPGVYTGIPLDTYHQRLTLFDAPSVSKSSLKWIVPGHPGASPKAFWGRWAFNPHHVTPKTSDALDFGKATHCLLLGDEAFDERFAIRPEKAPDGRAWNGNNGSCKEWLADQASAGRTVITAEQLERIKRMHADAAQNDIVRAGILNGRIEHSMLAKDWKTGLWMRSRPDSIPFADGVFGDLKTTSKFDEDFLQRQCFDAGYYLQGAMTRMVCRELELPFETFVLVYVLADDVPDTTHVELRDEDLDLGERAIRYALNTIRTGLDTGHWPGARLFRGGESFLGMKPWDRDRLSRALDEAENDNLMENAA
ncbi:PD-(D/E)XK nuclease-like domain-containing protein [Acuticoccus sediminis]|uniref:PD-(D/E)XK nuclease-like domain-containing protein n=1 Tax=Acuticoccus sediminis TaxID=2184697 RepID=UPI001CFC61B6|nr:PD-(D/E)XK nuclease-like domain-containing protein [Acuticoccus sediminis]